MCAFRDRAWLCVCVCQWCVRFCVGLRVNSCSVCESCVPQQAEEYQTCATVGASGREEGRWRESERGRESEKEPTE